MPLLINLLALEMRINNEHSNYLASFALRTCLSTCSTFLALVSSVLRDLSLSRGINSLTLQSLYNYESTDRSSYKFSRLYMHVPLGALSPKLPNCAHPSAYNSEFCRTGSSSSKRGPLLSFPSPYR